MVGVRAPFFRMSVPITRDDLFDDGRFSPDEGMAGMRHVSVADWHKARSSFRLDEDGRKHEAEAARVFARRKREREREQGDDAARAWRVAKAIVFDDLPDWRHTLENDGTLSAVATFASSLARAFMAPEPDNSDLVDAIAEGADTVASRLDTVADNVETVANHVWDVAQNAGSDAYDDSTLTAAIENVSDAIGRAGDAIAENVDTLTDVIRDK